MTPASHRVLTSLYVLSSAALLAACGDDNNPQAVMQEPIRDEWRTEHEGPIDLIDDDADPPIPRINDITIGTPDPFGDNFLNRGDVIVDFTGEEGTIKIELRRFTFANSEAQAEEDIFPKIELWAYNASIGTPKKPSDMEEDADCTDDAEDWLDGCGVYIYYDGQNQLERAGADIRVTLPPDYRQNVDVLASDNLIEDSYPNHGDVCVNGLNGSADIALESGIAVVKLADDVTPAPGCPAALYNDCTDVDDPSTTAGMVGEPWPETCPCASMRLMGNLTVEADDPYSADITIDTPIDLWTSVTAENEAGGGGSETCPVDVMDNYGDRFVPDEAQFDPNEPWRLIGDANKPSDAALAGGGFAFKLTSAECNPVAAVENPKDWVADGDPDAETRGFIEVCTGCLSDNPCDDLPGSGD
jgi:hypothetical protein